MSTIYTELSQSKRGIYGQVGFCLQIGNDVDNGDNNDKEVKGFQNALQNWLILLGIN